MREKSFHTVIALDTEKGALHFCCRDADERKPVIYFTAACKESPFSDAFAAQLSDAIEKFRESHPDVAMQRVSLVLSDNAVLTDTVNLPLIHRRAANVSIDASLSNLYGGESMCFNRVLALQNKQFATYAVTGMHRDLLLRLRESFAKSGIEIANVTYASAAATNAAVKLNPRLKSASFVLLDIKNDSTKIAFVCAGRTLGFYSLPFGASVLNAEVYTPEEMLFDHACAELLVSNTAERADADTAESEQPTHEGLHGKTPRVLPGLMQREIPTDAEGILYENFRVFVKWTLELIASNASITALGAPEAVYVNMPRPMDFLTERVNAEAEENCIRFLPLEGATDALIRENLELYGGFFMPQSNRLNSFLAADTAARNAFSHRIKRTKGKSQ